jgi:hypothetical protein
MLVQTLPDTLTKLAQMGEATIYEPAGDQPQQERRRVPYQSRSLAECITNVVTPKGKKPILKTVKHPCRSTRWACEAIRLATGEPTRATARLAYPSSALGV